MLEELFVVPKSNPSRATKSYSALEQRDCMAHTILSTETEHTGGPLRAGEYLLSLPNGVMIQQKWHPQAPPLLSTNHSSPSQNLPPMHSSFPAQFSVASGFAAFPWVLPVPVLPKVLYTKHALQHIFHSWCPQQPLCWCSATVGLDCDFILSIESPHMKSSMDSLSCPI